MAKAAGYEIPELPKATAVKLLGQIAGKIEQEISNIRDDKRSNWLASEKAATITDLLMDIAAVRMATAALISAGDD